MAGYSSDNRDLPATKQTNGPALSSSMRLADNHDKYGSIGYALLLLVGYASYTISRQVPLFGDDVTHLEYFASNTSISLRQYLVMMFNTWSPRPFVEALTYLYFSLHLYKEYPLINTLSLIIYSFVISKYVSRKFDVWTMLTCFCALSLMSKETMLTGIFWITGSLAYFIPTIVLLGSLLPLYYVYSGQAHTLPLKQFFPMVMANIVCALSNEQMSTVLMLAHAAALVFPISKSVRKRLFISFVVTMAVFLFCLLSDGTRTRLPIEYLKWFPGLESGTVSQLWLVAIHWAVTSFTRNFLQLTLAFSLLPLLYFKNYSRKMKVLTAIFAVQFAVVLMIAQLDGSAPLSQYAMFYEPYVFPFMGLTLDDYIRVVEPSYSRLLTTAALWLLFVIQLFVLIFYAIPDRRIIAAMTSWGILSGAVFIFSPTLYASANRIFFVPQTILLLTASIMLLRIPVISRYKRAVGVTMFVVMMANLHSAVPTILRGDYY